MLRKILVLLKKAGVDSGGTVTLEATIIMPAIMLMLFGLAMFSMFIYQKFVILDTAAYTAKQRAATWSSDTGAEGRGEGPGDNGLYWRLFNDYGGSVEVIGSQINEKGPDLVRKKNREAEGFITQLLGHSVFGAKGTGITVEYKNRLLTRTVLVNIKQDIIIPFMWLSQRLGTTLQARALSEVTEPDEYIRNVDIAASYSSSILSKIKDYLWPADKETQDDPQPSKFIGSKASPNGRPIKVYHYPGCKHIAKIKPENLVEFASVSEAGQQGYYLCIDCAKRISNY